MKQLSLLKKPSTVANPVDQHMVVSVKVFRDGAAERAVQILDPGTRRMIPLLVSKGSAGCRCRAHLAFSVGELVGDFLAELIAEDPGVIDTPW